jgi:hypothetical protein
MSNRYKGAVISATPPTTTGGSSGTASGAWTLEQQMQAQAAGLWPSPPPPPNIEDVFSTYLYAGSNSSQTITNNIDLSTNGGLVWTKARTTTYDHFLTDTIRGGNKQLSSNNTGASVTSSPAEISSFNTTGYTLAGGTVENVAGQNFVGWTFREQAKFFDIVTYTGTGSATTIAHNLGSVPGCIIVKCTSTTGNWVVYHRSAPSSLNGYLNTNDDFGFGPLITSPTSTQFSINTAAAVNSNGATYVAYLWAHDAGGFGLTGTDNVISCGGYTGTGALLNVSLGYEPQWILIKDASGSGNWRIFDNMRGWPAPSGQSAYSLLPNEINAEIDNGDLVYPTATGIQLSTNATYNTNGRTYIYIAIRRGPMAVPTLGTSVFSTDISLDNANPSAIAGFVTDMIWTSFRNASNSYPFHFVTSRLINGNRYLETNSTNAETSGSAFGSWDNMVGAGTDVLVSASVSNMAWMFKRAPGYFDVVCYTGTGANRTVNHNLGIAPELIIIKARSFGQVWVVGNTATGFGNYLLLNSGDPAAVGSNVFNNTAPTSTVFSLGDGSGANQSAATYVAYLFATVAGVSKVGSYTGTGALQTVNCGFTTGARFVMVKRTNSPGGSWYVWDSARGITSGNDPYITINTIGAEVTGTNYVDTDPTGFKITAAADAEINASGSTFIFLAIA